MGNPTITPRYGKKTYKTRHIYVLKLEGNIIYVGQTYSMEQRLSGHLYSRGFAVCFPDYIKKKITIELIESCDTEEADEIERYWIKYYAITQRIKNVCHVARRNSGLIRRYIALRPDQQFFVRTIGFTYVASQIGLNAQTLRIATARGRLKANIFLKIFTPDNELRFNKILAENAYMNIHYYKLIENKFG